ncbi:hypothetical protein GCM10007423_58200 [Dyadobacter endophyticus]|uniref:Uncharacterized protein n=1 Tax=Dyadobacter endophyticus TaxID=1749036 RepID=A0ABQ1Z7M4_9BACT|nr:hypothetical protein GCM10007423_58200 [Dyadobacter endophyticus]
MAGKFVGEYCGSKKDSTGNITETWKITKQDLNHVSIVFFFTNTYPDGSVIRSKYDIYISNVTVSDDNNLDFNNVFVADQLEYSIIGKAKLVNNTLDYDITIKSEYNTSKMNNKVYRR